MRYILILMLLLFTGSCDLLSIEDRPDPNGPSLEDLLQNPTRAKLANLAIGIESASRFELGIYLIDVGMIGREYWRFSSADPRFTGDLLGKGTAVLDNNTFYITRPWGARYRVVRNAYILLEALPRAADLNEAEKKATAGFAKTFIAYQLLLNLNLTYDNGIRVDVAGPEPGPIVSRSEALAFIARLLDEAAQDLSAGGDAFPFPLSSGFAGFNTPATFRQFNRALAARVAAYREQFDQVLTLLAESFYNPSGDLRTGVYHSFSTASGDLVNPLFFDPNAPAGDALVAHPSFAADAEPGDQRLSKVVQRNEPASLDGLTSTYGFYVYPSASAPIPIIRNAELILLAAEAHIQLGNLNSAVTLLNHIRNTAGLPDYTGPVTQEALLDELLRQRRYELYGEGHRWIDLRRYNRLDELPLDRPGDDVWRQFPIPATENL
ncbi:RagB/SusD domain-containing protein [Rhodothermus profundi]|uniref:RagB/SusD domain-containing protein n=2 Tax=Rhodothermus profundi TaxID=633813 RepID=A0A1M6WSX4_9BACT|nr:RagB/SusD domain-containing protein [Rhodothermus profundi]